MKKSIIYKLLAIIFIVSALSSCVESQEVEPVQSTADYPVATFNTDADLSNIKKGDVIVYTITMDKMMNTDITFGIRVGADSEADESSFEVSGGVMDAFAKETTLNITVLQDNFPEVDKSMAIEVGAFDLGTRFLLNPTTSNPKIATQLVNVNDPDALTVNFGWDDPEHETDLDLLVISELYGSWSTAATSANPEIDLSVTNDDDDDIFYFGFDPFDVPNEVTNYTVRVGHPNGTVEVFEGVINKSTITNDFIADDFAAWGIPSYRLIKVIKTGDNYVVTFEGN
ncbi:hypothetical protein MNBD_UNCLBAC01-1185 [hydrothermal vent metagenome]|uniref:Calx-beta domain-containing protein n=1 Tax=hydrothermal vent metagenome TaxID=652676 RepID=A0A3B1E381_9ZZZZ